METDELLALGKELSELENLSSRSKDVEKFKREYARFNAKDTDSYAEALAAKKLLAYQEAIASKEGVLNASVVEKKKAILAEAKSLLQRTDIMAATKDLESLLLDFKATGRGSKQEEDELWAEMKEIRTAWQEKKDEYFAKLKENNAAKHQQKLAIIDEAKAVLQLENYKEAGAKMDELFARWKAVGFSGKEDDALWQEFSALRGQFMSNRRKFYEQMRKAYAERAEKKGALIKQTRFYLADAKFTPEDLDKIKEFRAEWKAIGFAGKEQDEALFKEFNAAIEQYFQDRKDYLGH